ncbi:MAG: Rrf2 family transcriptional regulator [Gammaproteobacteria bacterium]
MKLSTKGRYAVTAMLNLAIHDQRNTVTLADISQCQGISLSYLEQLFAKLRKHRLVKGIRGPGGGYRLARPMHEISVAQIITAVDERTEGAGERPAKPGSRRPVTQELWDELSERLYDFLDGITLAELADRPEVREVAQRHLKQQHNGYRSDKKTAA